MYYYVGAGVAIGAGWQALVAYVNIACYYLIGIPAGLLLGYKLNMGVQVSLPNLIRIFIYLCLLYKNDVISIEQDMREREVDQN